MDIPAEPVVVGGKYRWPFTAYRDGEAFDLTGATITLSFYCAEHKISKKYEHTATAETTHYDNPEETFTKPGVWEFSWKVVLGQFKEETQPRQFKVWKSLSSQ